MKKEFKVGDIVYIDEPEDKDNYPPTWVHRHMDKYVGKYAIINENRGGHRYTLIIDDDENKWVWHASNLKDPNTKKNPELDFY